MPYVVVKDIGACSIDKPWAVKNAVTGDVRGRCHADKASASDQQKALYASLRKEAQMKLGEGEYFLVPVENLFAEGDVPTGTDNTRWVQAFPYDTWDHPVYGKTTVDVNTAKQYVKNFKDNVRGQDLAINYDHGTDTAKGNKAAGWIKDMEARSNGLFLKVDFTPTAVEELKNGEWRYFSSESYDTWTHPHTKKKHQFVLTGGALTNKPWVKGMLPINFSEVLTEEQLKDIEKEFAVWSTSYINGLPDSSFLYVESGGTKDSEGKTTPRVLRHLPYKDDTGKIDLAHLKNAIARIPQMVAVPQATKDKLQARAKSLLSGANKMSELSDEEQRAFSALLVKTGLDVVDESKELEHSEPGTGSPPSPRTDGDGSDELDRTGGFRRGDLPPGFPDTLVTPGEPQVFAESYAITALKSAIDLVTTYVNSSTADPACKIKGEMWLANAEALLAKNIGEVGYSDVRNLLYGMPDTNQTTDNNGDNADTVGGGSYMSELTEKDVRDLMRAFDVDDEGKLVEAVKLKFGEFDELKRLTAVADQEAKFAEQYPEMWQEHNKLMETTRESEAKTFSESVQKVFKAEGHGLRATRQGLSSRAIDAVVETHKKFAAGTATLADFENTIKSITHGGLLEYGETGSTGRENGDEPIIEVDDTSATGVAKARAQFAELVQKELDSNSAEWSEMPYTEKLLRASEEVAKKHPELAKTYRVANPA